jgi:hypothetical protein
MPRSNGRGELVTLNEQMQSPLLITDATARKSLQGGKSMGRKIKPNSTRRKKRTMHAILKG